MVAHSQLIFALNNEKSHFRSIIEADVTEGYVEGLRRQTKYITARSDDISLQSQQEYVRKIAGSDDDALFGLFRGEELVATSGVQGIRTKAAPAIGIFVFESALRGRGFGKALVWCASYLVHQVWGVKSFSAGMKRENIPSLRSFLSCGFTISGESGDSYLVNIAMSELRKPQYILDVEIHKTQS